VRLVIVAGVGWIMVMALGAGFKLLCAVVAASAAVFGAANAFAMGVWWLRGPERAGQTRSLQRQAGE
jgi:hypothetical protein